MAALSITASNVIWQSGPREDGQIAGEAFDAGDCVYRADSGKWLKAQCDGTAIEAGANDLGMALSSADANGSYCSIAKAGAIVAIGAGLAGIVYCPGTTAGDYIPTADLASTNKATIGALGIGTNQLLLVRAYNSGSVLA